MNNMKAIDVLHRNVADLQALLDVTIGLSPQIEAAAGKITKTLLSGGTLLACGNGGSSAEASHLTSEFVCRYKKDRRPYPAICLSAHGGDLTAIGNDYVFDDIFARQVHAFGHPGDILIVFTTSGRSENVRRALVAAKERKLVTIAFLGKDGGLCAGLADIELLIQSAITARIQEMHQLLFHTICELAEEQL
jgi:D-sedoheptulose 7-phosphate isomerase